MEANTPHLLVKAHRYFHAHGARKTLQRATHVCYWNTIVRFLEWRFDRRFGVQTGGLTYFHENNIAPLRQFGTHYEATSPRVFAKIVRSLGPLAAPFAFYDMGCGKGRVLIMAAQHDFRRVVGVELDPELYNTAAANVTAFQARHDCRSPIEVALCNAAEFQFPDEDSVIFFFNPFRDSIMLHVLENIRRSAVNTKYRYIVYNNPVLQSLFDNPREFALITKDKEYAIYRMRL